MNNPSWSHLIIKYHWILQDARLLYLNLIMPNIEADELKSTNAHNCIIDNFKLFL